MTRPRLLLLLTVVLLVAAAVAGVAQPRLGRAADAGRSTITVTGTGSVSTVPDRASFAFSVDAHAAGAGAALAKIETAEQSVLAAVKSTGVADADIQTTQVSLSPTTSQNGAITGYTASITITAVTSLAGAGALVDAAVGAGATGVSGPNLTQSDQDGLYRQALAKAVANAAAKAKAIAAAAAVDLGPAQTVVEGSTATPIVNARGAAAPSLPIEPGTQTVDATVTVTYTAS